MTKRFELRVLLTVTTGRLLTAPKGDRDNGISDLYELLGWMTIDEPFTHQLPRFAEECKPWLLRWFPELAECGTPLNLARLTELIDGAEQRGEPPSVALDMWLRWMSETGTCPGIKSEYDVPRIPADDHERKHPYDEMVAMRGTDEGIIVVEPPDIPPTNFTHGIQ
jgi:hypothetical protein